jgi:hypothetical protein
MFMPSKEVFSQPVAIWQILRRGLARFFSHKIKSISSKHEPEAVRRFRRPNALNLR